MGGHPRGTIGTIEFTYAIGSVGPKLGFNQLLFLVGIIFIGSLWSILQSPLTRI
jgi:hypothetical protein